MNYQEQRKTLHNDKKNQEDKANPECVYAKQQSYKVREAKCDPAERRNRQLVRLQLETSAPFSAFSRIARQTIHQEYK